MAALANEDLKYDPAEKMLTAPVSSPGYHTKIKTGQVHGTRVSITYAAALLDADEPERLHRAKDIFGKMISLQDQNPASKTYGIWSWFLEEPLDKMAPPDWNWADFCSVQLLHAWIHHRDQLGTELADKTRDAILHAARSIKKRNVGPGYTNIAIMGTYVSIVAGEQFGDAEILEYGRARLRRFHAYTFEQGSFTEYNSPTYTIIAVAELSRMLMHVQDSADRKLVTELHDFAWKHIVNHFHAPTRQWAGPHSRSYSDDLRRRGNALSVIQAATGVDLDQKNPLPLGLDLYRLPLTCPKELVPQFAKLTSSRNTVETFSKAEPARRGGKNPVVGTTFLHPQFALGTVNRSDLWNQRRPVLAYWGTPKNAKWFRIRFLHDNYDFTSALVFAAQREGSALVTVGFANDYGDTHPTLDKPKVPGRITAKDLRLRFEFGGDVEGLTAKALNASHGMAEDKFCTLTFDLLGEAFDGMTHRWETGAEDNRRFVDRVVYSGASREIDFNAIKEAFFCIALNIFPGSSGMKHQAADFTREGDFVTTNWPGGISVSALRKPSPLAIANDAAKISA